jgi:hypothetical protein
MVLNWVIKNKLNLNRSHGSKNPIKFCMIFTHITYGVWFDGAIWSPLDEWTLKHIIIGIIDGRWLSAKVGWNEL